MLFNSYIFILCFLPITVIGYYVINPSLGKKRESLALMWLSLVSFCFFGYGQPRLLPVLLGSILVNYLFGNMVRKEDFGRKKRFILGAGILIQLFLLLYYKYTGFLIEIIGQFFKINSEIEIEAPLGISFFTFSQISWLVDVYKEKEKHSFWEYCTYISFFPKLTMGPIALQKEFIPQLYEAGKKNLSYDNLSKGIYIFSLGLAKKVLLADTLAKIVAIGYADVDKLNTLTALVVILSYTLQLYFDFSGYCDMAMGIGLFFNLDLPLNFNAPYAARSISEFWSRWHMTLTKFFTGYLYIPLGGSRKGKVRTYVNTFFVFLVSGLWHGANWTFLFWGGLHGVCMVVEKMINDLRGERNSLSPILEKMKGMLQWVATFSIVNIAWVFFRAESMEQAKAVLVRLFSGGWQLSEKITEYVLDLIEIRIIMRLGLTRFFERHCVFIIIVGLIILVLLCVFMKNTEERIKTFKCSGIKGVITVVLMIWCIISLSSISEFLYFEF